MTLFVDFNIQVCLKNPIHSNSVWKLLAVSGLFLTRYGFDCFYVTLWSSLNGANNRLRKIREKS